MLKMSVNRPPRDVEFAQAKATVSDGLRGSYRQQTDLPSPPRRARKLALIQLMIARLRGGRMKGDSRLSAALSRRSLLRRDRQARGHCGRSQHS